MDAFVTGTIPQKRQVQLDAIKQKSGRPENKTAVISTLALQLQKRKALSIHNVLFAIKFYLQNVCFQVN